MKVSVCPNCDYPLMFTFIWDYHEWYCLNCGGHYGMFGVDTNEVDIKILRRAWGRWGSVRSRLIPNSARRTDCDKCDKLNEPHSRHLTDKEKNDDIRARQLLQKWRIA